MINKKYKITALWSISLFFTLVIFQFLHESGHGFGARLDGRHISTGFNRVGTVGKRPSDSDFREKFLIEGKLQYSSLLGPFTNWIFAILFTSILFHLKRINFFFFLTSAGALSNSLIRLVPMSNFFINAALGKFVIEDEVSWGLHSIKGLKFPMYFTDFKLLVASKPSLFLSEPEIYFWPLLSLIICSFCCVFTYYQMYKLLKDYLLSVSSKLIFGFMPLFIWPFVLILTNELDNLIRINW